MKLNLILPAIISSALLAGCATAPKPAAQASAPAPHNQPFHEVEIDGIAGFQDTPLQPGLPWHVHDPARPQPPTVTPGTFSDNATPPSDATVLFNGTDLSQWHDKGTGGPVGWKVEDGVAISAKGDIETQQKFGDIQLHVEFREPNPPPRDGGQGRGNSGVFLMGLYEIQVLDCYTNKTYADGATGGIYGQHPPTAMACRPPGEWQTYDIIFNPPHFDDAGNLVTPAYATVILNGVVIQNHQAIRGETNWRSLGDYKHKESTGPIALQYHHNSVAFRNIWVRPIPVVTDP